MVTIEPVGTRSKAQVRRFVELPYRLYAGTPQWVPPLRPDVRELLDRRRHPFYEHSEAAFFLATRDGRDVGRIAALENRPFNAWHGVREADFYCFECEDDAEAESALFERVFEWARARGLTQIVGPKGFTALDGYGLLVEGFEHRQLMTMTNYNPARYPRVLERFGFAKVVDFVSWQLDKDTFVMPPQVRAVAERVKAQGTLRVVRFPNKRALVRTARAIGRAYNRAFVNNWEYYPLTDREIDYLVGKLMVVADPRLIKIIAHGDEFVGFLFVFPDLSAALQRARGRLGPLRILDLLLESRRTEWVAMNGAGILPAYQGLGGNALLYTEIEDTVRRSHFRCAELPQVAETAVQMRRDLAKLQARPFKTHRVFGREV